MNIVSPRIFQTALFSYSPAVKREQSYHTSPMGLDRDVFIKSPSFEGQKKSAHTEEGAVLKELDNITCPYSGVKMLSYGHYAAIHRNLERCNDISEGTKILSKHEDSMQPLEKEIYNHFQEYAKKNPEGTANDCLQELYPKSLAKLRIQEFKVLDNIDNLSDKLEPEKNFRVRKITTDARKKIVDNQTGEMFKRKDLLFTLLKVKDEAAGTEDEPILNEMWDAANKLPRAVNNFDSFVVKYANRTQEEILSRLLSPSIASIEHITPKSIVPDNTLPNFMLATTSYNSERGNLSLSDYIKKHPDIPKHAQSYTDDIIKAIRYGKLKNMNWYPYMLKEHLYNESNGIIDVSLLKYPLSEEEALKDATTDIVEKYNNYKELNKSVPV